MLVGHCGGWSARKIREERLIRKRGEQELARQLWSLVWCKIQQKIVMSKSRSGKE
jgi:hypothetical protein